MAARFPKRGADGSFRVRAILSGPPSLEAELRSWLSRWVESNETWEAFGETHAFADCFAAPPAVEAVGELAVIFTGAPGAPNFWKDWAVRILSAAREHVPQLGEVVRVENA